MNWIIKKLLDSSFIKFSISLLVSSSLVASVAASANTTTNFDSTTNLDNTINYEGTAYSIHDEKVLYREQHSLIMNAGQPVERTTLYYDADNTLFAEKNNRYGTQAATPDFILTDDRYGYSESMEQDGTRWRVEYKEPKESGEKTLSKPDYTPVIDAGFDEFVRANWDKLLRDDTVNFSFAVPSRLEWIDFRLIPKSKKDGVLQVEMRLKSRFIAWLLAPVFLSYDIESKRLVTYRGLTNIRDANGEGIQAEIRYTYPQTTSQ